MKLKPLNGRVIIKEIKPEEKTKGGIIIPDTAKEKSHKGIVVAVGDLIKSGKESEVQIGDMVLYGKYDGTPIGYEGENYLIMKETDLIAIIE